MGQARKRREQDRFHDCMNQKRATGSSPTSASSHCINKEIHIKRNLGRPFRGGRKR